MSDQEGHWPVPKFYFKVNIGNKGDIAFQEVSGMDTEDDPIEYRAGNSLQFSMANMPGVRKASDITLKKGMFQSNSALYDYFMDVQMNTVERETVTIQLLDEAHNPTFTWTLKNAWPLKLTSTDMDAQDSEVAIEELVLSHEGLTFENA
jgi:phage tail-like protein